MQFLDYLRTDKSTLDQYLSERWVTVQHHGTFPLDIYTYGRTCQYEGKWDNITSRCRGVIVHRETGEIVARPFEKFHNFETQSRPETHAVNLVTFPAEAVVWEKVDGFLCTLYEWEGREYIASKGSFKSPHAKWATDCYVRHKHGPAWPAGWTPVFEGVTPNLRIVVDYGKVEELVLLAVINKETGEEMPPEALTRMGFVRGFGTPKQEKLTWVDAVKATRNDPVKGAEGFVVTWYGHCSPPLRVKLKYIDYLRLHRIVSGVSPKNIWEALSEGMSLDEWENDSTQWFAKFVAKWKRALNTEYARIEKESTDIFQSVQKAVNKQFGLLNIMAVDYVAIRKAFAEEFNKYPELAPVLFAMLDNKKLEPVIWKKVKRLIIGSRPMIDVHAV